MARLKHAQGLDKPIVVQYEHFIGKFVDGDWGTSSRTGDSVTLDDAPGHGATRCS